MDNLMFIIGTFLFVTGGLMAISIIVYVIWTLGDAEDPDYLEKYFDEEL